MKTFEDFLMERHSTFYKGVDDDMSDDFNDWLSSFDINQWLLFGDIFRNNSSTKFAEKIIKKIENTHF